VGHAIYSDHFLLGLSHLPLEHGTKVGAPRAQQFVGIDGFALNDERDVRKLLFIEEASEI